MESAWQIICGQTLPSSTSSVASSTRIKPQEFSAQMEMNMKHYYCSHGEPRQVTRGMTQESAFSSMSSSHSCKAASPEITNSFLALLSGPPSLFQDSHKLSDMKLVNGSNSPTFGSARVSTFRTAPIFAHFQDTGNKNIRSGIDMHPVLSSRYSTTANTNVGRLSHDELDAVRELITHAGGAKDVGNASLSKEGYLGSWTAAQDEIFVGTNSWGLQRTSEVASSLPNKLSSVTNGPPRVFCFGTCGDLLLSNTGLLGVACSCHGLPMSISKFCEHAGLSNVNPGDAVHMDSGETIAHWRKLYLLKLGIKVPDDHKEWDWPEEFSLSAAGAKCDIHVTERTKKFDFPDLVGSSLESMKSGHLSNDVFGRNCHASVKYVGEMSGDRNLGSSYDWSGNLSSVLDAHIPSCPSPNCLTLTKAIGKGPENCSRMDSPGRNLVLKSVDDWQNSVLVGMSGCSKSNLCAVPDKHTLVCPSPNYLTGTKAVFKGPQNDYFLSCSGGNAVSKGGISSVSAFQNLASLGSETRNNLREGLVLNRGVISSSTELKLGQPYQQCWTLGSELLSATGTQTSYPQKIFSEQLIRNCALVGNSRAMENSGQHFQWNASSSDSSRREDKCQVDLMSHVIKVSAGSDACHVERLKDDLGKSSTMQNPSSWRNVHCKEGSKVISDSHCFIPWALHSQSQIKSQPVNFPCNRNDGTVGPLDTSRSALQKQVERTVEGGYWHNNASAVTEKSFRCYAEEMEKSGTFTRNIGDCHLPDSDAAHAKKSNALQFASALLDTCNNSNPSNYTAQFSGVGSSGMRNYASLRTSSSTLGIDTSLQSQTFSMGLSSSMSITTPNLNAFFNNNGVGVSPHILDESLRNLASRNVVESYKQQHTCTSSGLNQQETIHSSLCGLRMPSSILNPLTSGGPNNGPCYSATASEVALKSFLCKVGCLTGCDVEQMVKASGANSWEHLKRCTESVALHSKDDSHCQCFPNPLPNELSLPRMKSHVASLNMHENCCQGGQSTYVSGRCTCADHRKSLKRECDCKGLGSRIGLKQPLSIVGGEASTLSALRIHDSVAVEGTISVECNREVKGPICEKLDSLCSHCKDVPSKVKHKIKHIDEPADELNNKRVEVQLDGCVIEDTHRSDQEAKSSKVQELSTVSSGCSAPDVTQASVEANNIVSFTVDASEPRDANDQVVDQVSTIDKCYSSDDAIESERSGYLCSSGKINSVEEQPLKQHLNVDSHVHIKEVQGNMNQLRDNDLDGRSSSKYPGNSQKYGSRLNSMQRRRKTKWRTLRTSFASKTPLLHMQSSLCSGNEASLYCQTFKDPHLVLQSEQASSQMCAAHSLGHSSKRKRSFSSSFKSLPRKRSLDSIYNINEGEDNNQKRLKGDTDFVKLLQFGALEMLKQDKCTDAIKPSRKCGITNEAVELKLDTHSHPCYQNRKAKPIVCGMYGIISSGEDKIKRPKIIPLHQVLKTARTGGEFKNGEQKMAMVTELQKISFSGFSAGNCCNDWFPSSKKEGLSKYDMVQGGYASKRSSNTNFPAQSRPNCKEICKCSLPELCMEGERYTHPELIFSRKPESALQEKCCAGMEKLDSAGESEDHSVNRPRATIQRSIGKLWCRSLVSDFDASCCVCGGSNNDNTNSLVECMQCLIRVHQACYGILRVPKGYWYCRPCKTSSNDIACVLCGYGGGAMTRAVGFQEIVKSLLKAWNIRPESGVKCMVASSEALHGNQPCTSRKSMVHNSITAALLDSTVKQWVHVVCGLWTPGTRCPDVDTMSAFDVSGASRPKVNVVCSMCKRPGGSCIQCRVETCSIWFHPWCAHQKGLSQCEVEGVNNDKVGFYVSCKFHSTSQPCDLAVEIVNTATEGEKEATCARTEGFKGRKQDGGRPNTSRGSRGNNVCLVPQEQFNAWLHINRRKLNVTELLKLSFSDVEHDFRKEYARYKQTKRWKYLVVCNSGIHALGLYTSQFLPRGAMVVEYVGEIVGPRVADKREREYQSGRKLQYKSACYFFRIDKEHIIDATCKGGIARFVNHSCQPNCVAKIISIRNEKKVVFLAERDIYPGEEITYDYHFNHEDEGKKIPCFCNAKNCRRYLN